MTTAALRYHIHRVRTYVVPAYRDLGAPGQSSHWTAKPERARSRSGSPTNSEDTMTRDGEGYEYDDDHVFDYMDEDDGFGCGLHPNGQCQLAGSEECDWDCPHSRGPRYAGSEAWNKAHDAGAPIDGCECTECTTLRHQPN